jgi:hypothetical protein
MSGEGAKPQKSDYASVHNGRVFTPNQTSPDPSEVEAHNNRVEEAELAFLATKPDRFTAYIGEKLGDGTDFDKPERRLRRRLTTWAGKQIGTCFLSSSWTGGNRLAYGARMYQIYATVNGVDYTGRGLGEGMSCNFRRRFPRGGRPQAGRSQKEPHRCFTTI